MDCTVDKKVAAAQPGGPRGPPRSALVFLRSSWQLGPARQTRSETSRTNENERDQSDSLTKKPHPILHKTGSAGLLAVV